MEYPEEQPVPEPFTNDRGQRLHALAFWPGAAAPLKGALVWHHGHGEHSGRKADVYARLAAAGIAVFTYDMHGHGLSKPTEPEQRALLISLKHAVRDYMQFYAHALQLMDASGRSCDSWFAGGYSVGATIAALGALSWAEPPFRYRCPELAFRGLVLISPAIGLVQHGLLVRLQAAAAPLINWLAPRRKLLPAIETQHLNPDPAWVADYDADPLCYHGATFVSTAYQIQHLTVALQQRRKWLRLWPMYVRHCTADQISEYESVRRFMARLPRAKVDVVAGGYHDILSAGRLQRDCVDAMISWLS